MTASDWQLSSHLQELRRRLIVSFTALVVTSCVAYYFSETISHFFLLPLFAAQPELAGLVYTNLTEAFISYIKMSVLVGLIFSFPVIIYQLWRFIEPALYSHEKTVATRVVFFASLLFGSGVLFGYFIVLPRALEFLMSFVRPDLEPLPRLGAYLTFVARSSLAFGLAFEIPFLMVMAVRTGLTANEHFSKKRFYFYSIILVLAFLLAAGDVFSAGLLALPLFALYEAGIMINKVFA